MSRWTCRLSRPVRDITILSNRGDPVNIKQKIIAAAGVVLFAVRAAFPVKYAGFGGLRFEGSGLPEFMRKADWGTTGIHLAGIAVVTVVLVFIFKEK